VDAAATGSRATGVASEVTETEEGFEGWRVRGDKENSKSSSEFSQEEQSDPESEQSESSSDGKKVLTSSSCDVLVILMPIERVAEIWSSAVATVVMSSSKAIAMRVEVAKSTELPSGSSPSAALDVLFIQFIVSGSIMSFGSSRSAA
jgi:hypothetical protein